MTKIVLFLINFYKTFFSGLVSFLSGPGCRYQPTCADYAKQAIEKYGAFGGSYLSLKRLARCNPLFEPKIDPVP